MALVAMFALAGGGGCILLSSSDAETQCTSDDECSAFDAVCDLDNSVCVPRSDTSTSTSTETTTSTSTGGTTSTGPTGCTSNEQCVDDNGQLPYICRNPNQGEDCVSLISEDCSEVLGDADALRSDDVIVLGMLSTYTAETDAQLLDPERRRKAVTLAVEEIEKISKGLPPSTAGGARRKLVVLSCREEDDVIRASKHLVDVVGVPAILGPDDDERTLEAATEVTITGGVMMFAAQTKARALGEIDDSSLLWAPEYLGDAGPQAVAGLVPALEDRIRAAYGLTEGEPLRWAVILRDDALGTGLAGTLEDAAVLNGETLSEQADDGNYQRFTYPVDETDFGDVADDIIAFAPHIITILGEGEGGKALLAIEQSWPEELLPRPSYLLDAEAGGTDYKHSVSLTDPPPADHAPQLSTRYVGAFPTFPVDDTVHERFELRYRDRWDNENPQGVGSVAYDSAYMLAYAIVGAGAAPQLNGTALASGMTKLLGPGVEIEAGPDDLTAALSSLSAGSAIDFEGVRSAYQFDLSRGNSAPEQAVVCLAAAQQIVDNGYRFDPATREWSGTIDPDFCNLWPVEK